MFNPPHSFSMTTVPIGGGSPPNAVHQSFSEVAALDFFCNPLVIQSNLLCLGKEPWLSPSLPIQTGLILPICFSWEQAFKITLLPVKLTDNAKDIAFWPAYQVFFVLPRKSSTVRDHFLCHNCTNTATIASCIT